MDERMGKGERRRGVAVGECEEGRGMVIDECGGAGGDERGRGVVVGEYERDGVLRVAVMSLKKNASGVILACARDRRRNNNHVNIRVRNEGRGASGCWRGEDVDGRGGGRMNEWDERRWGVVVGENKEDGMWRVTVHECGV
jgi:hypothetical protein